MSIPSYSTARCCARLYQNSVRASRLARPSSQTPRIPSSRRWQSSTPEAAALDPKISTIVDQIGQLTLLETASLVSTLKERLNIPDLPIGGFAAGGSGAAAAAAPPPAEEEEAPAAAQEKTLFTLTLKSFETASKPKVIKEVKTMLGLSLVDSKKFVESAPKTMKEGVPKEEAEKIIEAMKALGAVATMD